MNRRQQLTRDLAELQGGKCYYCQDEMHFENGHCPDRATYDHMILASEGGELSMENGVAACTTCNSLRGSIHWVRWMSFISNNMFRDCVRNVKKHRRDSLEKLETLDKEMEAVRERLNELEQKRKQTVQPVKKAVRKYTQRFLKAVA